VQLKSERFEQQSERRRKPLEAKVDLRRSSS
jgi:hypothetical protein